MTRGLVRKLLPRLRARADVRRVPAHLRDDRLPVRPTAQQLRDATAAVESRQGRDADELAALLLAVDRDGDPRLVAGTGQLLLRAHPRVWLMLDVAARRVWWRAPRWSAVAVRRLSLGESSPLGLTLAAFHPDGHVREAAVARLAELHDTLAVPALTLRACDWVPQVRDRARPALEHRLAEPSTAMPVAALALALGERREGRWLADRIETVFREGPVELLTAALAAPDRRTRRATHLTALAAGRLDLAQMLHAAEHDDDLPIRIRCAEAAVKTAVAAKTLDLVRPLLSSGTAAVRAEAVQLLAREGDIAPAVAALADRSPTVRAVAQTVLRRAGSEPVEHYRRLVMTALPEPGAIAGLGETGTADDAGLIPSWLDHPQPRGRAAAVRALRRLGAADPDTLSAMLTDPSGTVTRQVTIALRPWASRLDLARLRELLSANNPHHIRTAAYRLLHERDTWTRLLIDLELVADPSPWMRDLARSDIAAWLTREAATTYSTPQGRTADALTRHLDDAEDALGPDQVRLLRFHLGLKPPSTA
ncbi:hypothetical protein [Streptomyces sp. NBC_00151]|uniref:hypothetical protein n=1 Tax=Streptomyces sp. NBC_00151 TaxID=2975669 RepID=UPI002DDADB74|nr:hypothetical protein [Streptomyces sp. NBC_00151]WRZ37661.1 hypothetical protein OG915_06130 [Streptomyces sp. NBC_00151]